MNNEIFLWEKKIVNETLTTYKANYFIIENRFNGKYFDLIFSHSQLDIDRVQVKITLLRCDTFEQCEKYLKDVILPSMKPNYSLPFVVLSCLPIAEQEKLNLWLYGQTRPTVKDALGNIINLCYAWDYQQFKEQEVRNEH